MAEPRVLLLVRQGCHLCDEARTVIAEVCAETGEAFDEVDIDTADDPTLRTRFTDQVPVTFVDGRQHDFWRVRADRLRAALRGDRDA